MSPTVLVTGATGFLGRQVIKTLSRDSYNVIAVGFKRARPPVIALDLLSEKAINEILDEKKPDVVIHCAADRSPATVAESPDAARALNVTATLTLSKATAARSIFLIYISTDYVFRGAKGEAPYAASAKTDPTNFYGETKRDGEIAVLDTAGQKGLGLVLRVPLLYGPAETPSESAVNCLVDIVKRAETGEKITVDNWAIRYPTCTEDVAVTLKDIVKKWDERGKGEWKGQKILQFSAEEAMTKYKICQIFAELLGLPDENIMSAEAGGHLSPYDAHLSTKELEAEGISAGAQSFRGWWRRELRAFRK